MTAADVRLGGSERDAEAIEHGKHETARREEGLGQDVAVGGLRLGQGVDDRGQDGHARVPAPSPKGQVARRFDKSNAGGWISQIRRRLLSILLCLPRRSRRPTVTHSARPNSATHGVPAHATTPQTHQLGPLVRVPARRASGPSRGSIRSPNRRTRHPRCPPLLSPRARSRARAEPRAVRRGDIARPVRVVTASSEGGEDKPRRSSPRPCSRTFAKRSRGLRPPPAVSKLPTEEELANGRKPKAGDLVSIVFSAQTEEGLLQAMDDMEEPITLEVGGAGRDGQPPLSRV